MTPTDADLAPAVTRPPPPPPVPRISRARFEAMLADPDIPDSALRPYVTLDPTQTGALAPVVIPNPATVAYPPLEGAVALASLNGAARWRRTQRYRRRIAAGWSGPKVVAEGDSWFQYPLLLDDVIDHLDPRWAILCLSAAGDLLADMARQDEIAVTVRAERPDLLLLSGGGNDVLGGGSLARHLHRHKAGANAAEHIAPAYADTLKAALATYADVIETGLTAGAGRVVCHSYDYAIPAGGRWLGRPLAALGIADPVLQRAIVRLLIDRFHDGLTALAGRFGGRVIVADCRGSVPDGQWHDELHPTSAGYARPAAIIRAAARRLGLREGVPGPEAVEGLAEAAPPPRPLPVGDAAAVEALLAAPEGRLLDEIGRRETLLSLRPEAGAEMTLALTPAGLEGIGDAFADLGRQLLGRWLRELHALMCGDGGAGTGQRRQLREALGLGPAALVGGVTAALVGLSCPPLLAPLLAAVVVQRGIDPAWEETCRWWGAQLGPAPSP